MSSALLPPHDQAALARWQRLAFIAGVAGFGVCLIGALIPGLSVAFFRAWLVAFNVFIGIALGSLVVLMLQYLTGGTWGVILRRPLEAATRTLPLMAILFIPLAFGLRVLYLWADPEIVAAHENLQHKAPYLNVAFFLIRAAIYFAIWCGLSWLLSAWSKRQDSTPGTAWTQKCEILSAPGMILYVLTITFASIDWVMSLEPHWYSTIYGAMFGMGQVLSGFTFAVAVVALLAGRQPLIDRIGPAHLRDLGNLMMAFLMVWAYLSLMQFLLIWSGNLPEEVPWYLRRQMGPWKMVALALIVLHFAVPFVILLSADVRGRRRALAQVAGLVLIMRIVDLLWLIVPAFEHGEHATSGEPGESVLAPIVYVAALVGIGGAWLGEYLRQLASRALLPEGATIEREEAPHG